MIIGTTPPMSRPLNLRKELFKSVENNQTDTVKDILSTGLKPDQRLSLDRKNPITLSLKIHNWEISALLIQAGWTTKSKSAQNNLGWMYYFGLGVEQNHAKAKYWYRNGAGQGSAIGQLGLGTIYFNEQNYAEASLWFRKAADQGNADAQTNLGWMYLKGIGVEQNFTKALTLVRKAAKQEDALAQNSLG
ncbi:tetratricopeptide repeat protein [Endozoicomonas sp. ONNA2]|uniref:tetratricopeptide repeat protein n=1 Tax=Endozoicomonas sp. ONNA2 TaxID=2828741 RepID=UPI002147D5C5|nr:tetratricopeptide repeat protein [Endozoicomonas sp. ONNA2]